MTWNTSNGIRVLEGAEAALVREVLTGMADELAVSIEESCEELACLVGVEGFDSLTISAKLATLRLVAKHLLQETPSPLALTAANESTVYAIFRTLFSSIQTEIVILDENSAETNDADPSERYYWRSLTLQAWDEASQLDGEEHDTWSLPKHERDKNLEHWEFLTERLADCILWDRDFEMTNLFLDEAPELGQNNKRCLGITNNYYSEAAPDLKQAHVKTALESLRAILQKTQ